MLKVSRSSWHYRLGRPANASALDDRAATHLSRLGVNPVVSARLRAWAEEDDVLLRDFVRYVLSDYQPPTEGGNDADR